MIKTFCFLAAFMSCSALAGNSDFDAYMNSNAKNKTLTSKPKNQEAFAATQPYRAQQQDPRVNAASGGSPTFKMGGTNSSGSFSGGGSGSGSFKPTAVTTKPVTNPSAPPAAQTANATNGQPQPYFGTVGKNPVINNPTTSGTTTSGTTTQASTASGAGCTREMYGRSPGCLTYGPSAATGYGGAVGSYVNAANQQANQIYGATGGPGAQQTAGQQSAAAAAAAAQAAQQNVIQNTIQQVQITIPR